MYTSCTRRIPRVSTLRTQAAFKPGSMQACTHVRLAKDLLVLLDPKRDRVVFVLLADGSDKERLAKVGCAHTSASLHSHTH